jgi:hypothetical protein
LTFQVSQPVGEFHDEVDALAHRDAGDEQERERVVRRLTIAGMEAVEIDRVDHNAQLPRGDPSRRRDARKRGG